MTDPHMAPPEVLREWELVECLGEGGFATVWRAERRSDHEPKALKFLRAEHRGKLSLLNEWDALNKARHPNVVCAEEAGANFLVMDLLEGPTLADEIRSEKLWPLAQTVELVGQLCDALGAVHDAGLVHHDVNPNNVILAARPMLVDFGCVTPIGHRHPNEDRHPQWLSPEANQRQPASPTDDLWPLPLLALAMLTGMSPVAGDPEEIWSELLSYDGFDTPKDPNLPKGFGRWWRKATHPEPEKRYRTAESLKRSLLALA